LILLALLISALTLKGAAAQQESPVLRAMSEELQRSFAKLQHAEDEPLYYLCYAITEDEIAAISASGGAIVADSSDRSRTLDVDLRVGSPKLDNTHEIRGGFGGMGGFGGATQVPIDNDPDAVKAALWQQTDRAYKQAQEQLIRAKANLAVKVEEERKADDFSAAPPVVHIGELAEFPAFDHDMWQEKVKALSAKLLAEPYILSANASFSIDMTHEFLVNNEGTRIQFSRPSVSVILSVSGLAEDGMDLSRSEHFLARDPAGLPDDETLNATADRLIEEIRALYNAPIVEPYHGPAILLNRAAGVYFHEIFGHRMEGHRQKSAGEGQTFTDKVGKQILPDFISIFDDPTLREFDGTVLNGYYPFDDEGVASERVTVVEKGILRNFLMSRTPIEGFGRSNAHGRRSPGNAPVSRQGNLIVESDKMVPFEKLRQMLIDECKAQGKPYGLVFADISGGFTMTQRSDPQAFKVIPLYVTRVYVDGRPDEVVRGVDIVGTPLSSFSKIVATGDDPDIFNGTCGAESGWVPVSAVAPSILMDEIEVERQEKSQDKPPILPPPEGMSEAKSESDVIFSALTDEMNRTLGSLRMEGADAPYYVELTLDDNEWCTASASFGALTSANSNRSRNLSADVRVGDYSFDNTNFSSGGGDFGRGFRMPRRGGGGGARVPIEDDYGAIRRAAWTACDSAYKQAVEQLAAKQACVQNRRTEDLPPDMSKEIPYQHYDDEAGLDVDADQWSGTVRDLSKLFREYAAIQSSAVDFRAQRQTQYFVNNEGFKDRRCDRTYVLTVSADGQAQDGMRISDGFRVSVRDPKDLPAVDELADKITECAAALNERAQAQVCEDYSGPVLLEDGAATALINSQFVGNLYSPRRPLYEDEETAMRAEGNVLMSKVGLRVFPDMIDVTDDPTAKEYDGEPLAGWYSVDDDGIAPQKITLVSDGKFVAFPMSRIPNKEFQSSNGHGRGGGGSADSCPSNVIVTSKETMTEDELKEDLISRCKDDGLDYGIIIRSFSRGGGPGGQMMGFGGMRFQMRRGPQGGGGGLAPARMYKVSVADGSETPVRDANLEGVSLKTLRDIVAAGDKPEVANLEGQGGQISIVCPSLLIEEMDLRMLRGDKPRLPYLKHPYFDTE
jgi:predicted Zn-dependent protease